MDSYEFPAVTQLAIPFFVIAILLELWLVRTGRAKGEFETRDTLTSLMMGTGNVVAGILLGIVSYTALLWLWQFRFFDLGQRRPVQLIRREGEKIFHGPFHGLVSGMAAEEGLPE